MTMRCSKPFRQGVLEYGCGQCLPCRINRRRVWTARLLLEAELHEELCFLTLTYSDDHLPADGCLQIRDYQLFLKRLRKAIEPRKISFYIVGEYGTRTERPHYHAVIFGFGKGLRSGLLRFVKVNSLNYFSEDELCLLMAWRNGDVHVGEVNEKSLAYACKHLTKGLKNGRGVMADGRTKEFARMSLRPAIGKLAMSGFADFLTTYEGAKCIGDSGDVPGGFRSGGARYPFGSYLKKVLREASGLEKSWSATARMAAMVDALQEYKELGPAGVDALRLRDLSKAKFSRSVQTGRNVL